MQKVYIGRVDLPSIGEVDIVIRDDDKDPVFHVEYKSDDLCSISLTEGKYINIADNALLTFEDILVLNTFLSNKDEKYQFKPGCNETVWETCMFVWSNLYDKDININSIVKPNYNHLLL